MAHYDIFRDQLGIKYPAFGHALWEPNPARSYAPVEVGDVGYIREGKFHRLFNALLPADHPSHQRFGVPEYHEPLRPGVADHIDSGVLSPNDFHSYGVTVASGGLDVFAREPVGSADVSFLCARKCGAVLSLPVTARREDTVARGDFAKWITRNIDTWFAFTRRLGLGLNHMEDIVLVTGRHRTRSWTNIAFYEGQAGAQVTFGVQVTDGASASINWQVERKHIQGAMLSQGPSGGGLPEDQCIFIRGFRVARAFKLFPRIRGAAEHTHDPGNPDSGPDQSPELEVISIPSFTKYRDPLYVLLEYIAERAPNCDLVLVHDDDLDRLRKIGNGTSLETLQPDAVVSFLKKTEPEISQVAYDGLSSENNITRINTRGSKVAVFSEELNSWDRRIPSPLDSDTTTPSGPGPVSPSVVIRPQHTPPLYPSPSSHHHSSFKSLAPSDPLDAHFIPDTQPQARDHQLWLDNCYGKTELADFTQSYYRHLIPQPSGSRSRAQGKMQPHPYHHTNHYQFVASHHQPPPPPSSGAMEYGIFENPQNHPFGSFPASLQRRSSVASNWTLQLSSELNAEPPSSDDAAFYSIGAAADQYSAIPDAHSSQQKQHHQHRYSSPTKYLTPGVALTAASDHSDGTPQSRQSISLAWTDNQPPPPHSTGLSNTPTGWVTFQASPKQVCKRAQGKAKQPKRRKTDMDVDDDVVEANVGANMPQPNRLPGACNLCKRLKAKCIFPRDENVCMRCKTGKHAGHCIVEGRKPKIALMNLGYLLAQMKQRDTIIESLFKQLHKPHLAAPISIEAYLMEMPSSSHHRKTIIEWLDQLQSSVRLFSARRSPIKDPFQLDTSDDESDESNDEKIQQPQRGSAGSPNSIVGLNNDLVEPDIEPYTDDAVPIGLLASLAISTSEDSTTGSAEKKGREKADDDDVGVAGRQYFMHGPSQNFDLRKSLIDKISPPEILVHKLVTPEDVEKLFDIFYTRINPFISLLEPKLHTPALTFSRYPFLFTVVCAISSRYSDKPQVYPIAMHFAKSAVANALVDGWKSVELCQAYILMSIYAVPTHRWVEDRSWLYTGLAIRIATDLNLHCLPQKKPTTEQQELEILNRTRIWIICFNLDKSTATQEGKPSTLKEDYIIRHSLEWYKSSNHNNPYDVHIIAYTSLFRIITQFHQIVFSDPDVHNGLNQSIDFRAVTLEYDRLLKICREEWVERFAQDSNHSDAACEFRVKLLAFYTNYARLVMFSFGFQKAFRRGFQVDDEVFFTGSLESAKTVVNVLVESLVPTGYIRFAPDRYFVFAAFASAFMLKLLRSECSMFISRGLEDEIYQLIERLVNTIGSPQIAVDERHAPMLYSRFLARLLSKHKRDGAERGRMRQHGPLTQQPQASSSAPVQQQWRRLQTAQQTPPSHKGASPSPFAMEGNPATLPDIPHSATFNDQPTVTQTRFKDAANNFTFDPVLIDDLLEPMEAIEDPLWMQTMMLPGFSWPTEVDEN